MEAFVISEEKIERFFKRYLSYYYNEFGVFPEKDINVGVGNRVVEIEIFDALPYTLSALINFFESEKICPMTALTLEENGDFSSFILNIKEEDLLPLAPLFG